MHTYIHINTSLWAHTHAGRTVWRFTFFFLYTKAQIHSDMAPLDLWHYWGQSCEEPCNLWDLLVHRFFPYLLQWRYAATQSLTGVAAAFRGGLNQALCHQHRCILTGSCTRKHTFIQGLTVGQHTHTLTVSMPPVVPSSHGTQQVWGRVW